MNAHLTAAGLVLSALTFSGVTAAYSQSEPKAAPPAPSKYQEVDSPGAARDAKSPYRSDTIEVPLAAAKDAAKGDMVEYMVRMKAGDVLTYAWTATGGGDLWHEFHGHTENTVTFYKKAAGTRHEGTLTAPFDGIHGWYFENRSAAPVRVTIRLGGFYEIVPK